MARLRGLDPASIRNFALRESFTPPPPWKSWIRPCFSMWTAVNLAVMINGLLLRRIFNLDSFCILPAVLEQDFIFSGFYTVLLGSGYDYILYPGYFRFKQFQSTCRGGSRVFIFFFFFFGGGAQKIMSTHTHHERKAQILLYTAGIQGPLKGPHWRR